MKKLFALLIGTFLALQTSVAFAAVTSDTEPTISTLLAFNRWLYANNFAGVASVNNNLGEAYAQAVKWDDHAQLSFVDIAFQQPNQVSCWFEFGSVNKPHEVFKANCVDAAKGEKMQGETAQVTATVSAKSLFDSPNMKLRKFVSDILGSSDMLWQVREYMSGASEANVEFTLSKSDGNLRWNWGISDGRELGMSIYADASQLNGALVFEGQ